MQSDIVVRYLTTYWSTAVCKTCRLMPCHGTRPRLRLKKKKEKEKKKKEKRPLRNVSNCMDFIVSNPQYFSKITSHYEYCMSCYSFNHISAPDLVTQTAEDGHGGLGV